MSEPVNQTTARFDVYKAILWVEACENIKRYQRAIRQYEELGISGTEHDIEHRKMLADATKEARRLKP